MFGGFHFLFHLGVMLKYKTVRAARTRVRKLLATGGRFARGRLNGDGQRYVRSAVGGSAQRNGSAGGSERRRGEREGERRKRRGDGRGGAIRAKDF